MVTPPPAQTPASESLELTLRPAEPDDAQALEQMFEICFGTPRSAVEWRWRWFDAPGGRGEARVLEGAGRPVGHWAGVATDLWLRGQRSRVLLGGDVMVLPEFRRRGGMGRLVREAQKIAAANADAWIGFATDEAARVTVSATGATHLGRLPAWVAWPRRVPGLPGPAGALAAGMLALWRASTFAALPSATIGALEDVPAAELDELAAASASYAPCIRVRDSRHIRWRWLDRPVGHVDGLAARTRAGRLSGYLILGTEERGGRRIGRILDVLAADPPALRGLVRAALARLSDCDVVTFDYLDPRPWSTRALRLAGFVRRPGKAVTAWATSDEHDRVQESLGAWYLTRGDTDVS